MAEAQRKRIPPLAWIILAVILVAGGWMLTHHDGLDRPPSGGPASGQAQTGGPGGPVMPQQPTVDLSPTAPPAPNGAGPTNQPGVLSQPTPNGAPS